MEALLQALPVSAWQMVVVSLGVGLAYVIFGLAGFGTALIAAPLLVQFVPVAEVVPTLSLLDFTAAILSVWRDGRSSDTGELRAIFPPLVLGCLAGAAILLLGKPEVLLLGLGLFAVTYAIYSLSGIEAGIKFSRRAAIPFGLVGGVFSALFGSGGFIYAIYLSGRIESNDRFRVTQSTLIGLSAITRVVLFLLAGVYADRRILMLAVLLAPAMLIGVSIGRHITLTLSRAQFLKIVSVIVLVSGVGLIWRFLMA